MDVWWNPFAATRVGYQLTLVPEAQSWGYLARFTEALLETWWFALGWVRYAPPTWWVTIVAALSACAAIGVVRRFARDDARTRVLVVLATSLMAIQIAAVYWTYYRIAHGPQGKHLFPFLVPRCCCYGWVWTRGCRRRTEDRSPSASWQPWRSWTAWYGCWSPFQHMRSGRRAWGFVVSIVVGLATLVLGAGASRAPEER